MPAPIATLAREMLRDPATIQLARKAAPALGITQAVYPVAGPEIRLSSRSSSARR
jgi:ATP-dependent RNA helicase RhlE